MKILLVYPRWTEKYGLFGIGHFARRASTWDPLNLAYLAAVAEQQGHEVKIVDGEVENYSKEELFQEIERYCPDIVGLTATTPFYHVTLEFTKELKRRSPDLKTILGGAHITMLKEETFDKVFDFGVIGEGEKTWSEFLGYLSGNGKPLSEIKGLLYRNETEVVFNGEQDLIVDLDTIPFPARHLLRMKDYKIATNKGRKRFTSIMTSRGCPFKCIFCSIKTFGQRVRRRKILTVIEEIKLVVSEFNIRHFVFLDDTLTLSRQYILDLCTALERENIKITFEGSTCASYVDDELIRVMAKNGLVKLGFGLETINQPTRDIIKKVIPLESYPKASRICRKYGVETLNSVVLGLPGETRQDMEKTLDYLVNEKNVQNVTITIATPYPGTELYEMAKRGDYGLKMITDDFSKYIRFNQTVMESDKISAQELINLQNDGFLRAYSAWWRILPVVRKSGVFGLWLTFSRFIRKYKRERNEARALSGK